MTFRETTDGLYAIIRRTLFNSLTDEVNAMLGSLDKMIIQTKGDESKDGTKECN